MQFTFPVQSIESVGSLQEAKSIISSALEFQNLLTYCHYKFQMVRNHYIYCRCCQCSARLVFKKDGTRFVLEKAKVHHQHKKSLTNKLAVIDAIQNYPSCFSITTIKNFTMSRFQISSSTFYRYYHQAKSFGQTLDDVLISLESQGIFGVEIKGQQQDFPQLLLLTSELMIQKYHNNGKNIKFDITYNLIRQQKNAQHQYSVGVFVSANNNLNIQPHCIVIMANQTKKNFVRVFYQFFELMKSPPNTIITDQQKNIFLALEELKERGIFSGNHYLDIFHVLRNVKKSLFFKPTINFLIALSQSSNFLEYKKRREAGINKIAFRDQDLVRKFEEKMQRCCVGLLPPIFFGLSCTTNYCEKLNDLIKNKLPFSKKYIEVVGILSKFLQNMVKRPINFHIQKAKIERFSSIHEIQELRNRLNKRVFKKLMLEISSSLTCFVNLSDIEDTYIVKEQSFTENEYFEVKFSQQGNWACECELTQKIGLPCSHIIKVMLVLKQKIITGINHWWLLPQQQQSPIKTLIIRNPRKTRRHRL